MSTSTIIWIVIAVVVVLLLLVAVRAALSSRRERQHKIAVEIRSQAEEEFRSAQEKLAHADKIDPAVENRRSNDPAVENRRSAEKDPPTRRLRDDQFRDDRST